MEAGINLPDRQINWSPIRALMKHEGADMASRSSVNRMIFYLVYLTKQITAKALENMRSEDRTKISVEDIEWAIHQLSIEIKQE